MSDSPYSDPGMVAVYNRIAVPGQFAAPAQDLVEIVGLREGDVVLDVGTGTGAVATAARTAVGSKGRIVGADAAMEMIRLVPDETASVVVAQVPGLPFSDESFDVVIAGFVVSHFAKYLDGLTDMARVCRSGGRIGMSAWGAMKNPAADLWSDVAAQYFSRVLLSDAFTQHIPWDTWFSSGVKVSKALEAVALTTVVTKTICYSVRMTVRDYLLSRESSVQGLVLRQALSPQAWNSFKMDVSQVFQDKFGDIVEYPRDVHFGVGTKKSSKLVLASKPFEC